MAKERSSGNLLDILGGGGRKAEAKPASTQELPGTELSTMAEKQEGLLERILGARGQANPDEAKKDLAALHGVLVGLSQKTIVVIFAMGKLLSQVREGRSHGEFLPWIEVNCPFTARTARNYMRVYDRYKDEPRRALQELSISEAYLEAGVKKLTAPDGDKVRIYGDGIIQDDELPTFKEFAGLFKKPTLSGVPLKYHRIVPYHNGKIYVISEATGPVPVCDLYVDHSPQDESYQAAVNKAYQDMQLALEVFFGTVEGLEDKGVLAKPFDSSREAMVTKMRNVSAKTKPAETGKKKPAAKAGKGARK